MKKLIVALTLVATVSGCAAPRERTNDLAIGMTKAQVIGLLGEPDSSAASREQGDCLYYSMWRDFWNRRPGDYSDRYYTCFDNAGLLANYGRVGDPL